MTAAHATLRAAINQAAADGDIATCDQLHACIATLDEAAAILHACASTDTPAAAAALIRETF